MIEWLHNTMHPFDLDGLLTVGYVILVPLTYLWRRYAKGRRK